MTVRSDRARSPQSNIAFQDERIRISVISSRIIRIEKGGTTDLPTQTVWYRDLGIVPFKWKKDGTKGHLSLGDVTYHIDLKRGTVISAELSDGTVVKDLKKGILPGTARTLDMANGAGHGAGRL